MKNNLIGISGKIGSGKDTVGKVLQWIVTSKTGFGNGTYSNKECVEWLNGKYPGDTTIQEISGYKIKKYADKLKGGCEYVFPNEFSVKEWETRDRSYRDEIMPSLGISRRDFLLKRGDNCRAIHSDYFVNALFVDYKKTNVKLISNYYENNGIKGYIHDSKEFYPNWIITDVRFPNEAQAIKDRGGIVIRVNRDSELEYKHTDKDALEMLTGMGYEDIDDDFSEEAINEGFRWSETLQKWSFDEDNFQEHPSETALDDYEFDAVLNNEGSIEELIEKVKQLKLI